MTTQRKPQTLTEARTKKIYEFLKKIEIKLPGDSNLLPGEIIEKTTFDIPYIKISQFKKSHYSLFLGLFSDMGYVIDNQNQRNSNLSNGLLWGNGLSIDYVTYYDKLIRIEFSINHLGEKGVFLHFSNPFGET